MKIRNVLFDLDGTLTDPVEGITRSIRYALKQMGRPEPAVEDLLWCIGPPLLPSFEKLLGDGQNGTAAQALAHYRQRYKRIGKFENRIYDGIPEMLSTLTAEGLRLFLATSKPHLYARDIIRHYGFEPFFTTVHGSELNGQRVDKGELIAFILQQEGLEADASLMVGDRKYDIVGARQNRIKTIGVLYGYGGRTELEAAAADYLADTPQNVLQIIQRLAADISNRP